MLCCSFIISACLAFAGQAFLKRGFALLNYNGKRYNVSAVIAAAGASSRMGFDKLMAELEGVAVLWRTVAAFQSCELIDEIIIVTRKELVNALLDDVKRKDFTKVKGIISGAETRQRSVFKGVAAACDDSDLVCIHDAARPLVSQAVIENALISAAKCGAATAAVAVKDTIKSAKDGVVKQTIDRTNLYQIQTPQVFSKDIYLKAYEKATQEYSDDCQLIEQLGGEVALSQGDYKNIKLTTKEDFVIAAAFLDNI